MAGTTWTCFCQAVFKQSFSSSPMETALLCPWRNQYFYLARCGKGFHTCELLSLLWLSLVPRAGSYLNQLLCLPRNRISQLLLLLFASAITQVFHKPCVVLFCLEHWWCPRQSVSTWQGHCHCPHPSVPDGNWPCYFWPVQELKWHHLSGKQRIHS